MELRFEAWLLRTVHDDRWPDKVIAFSIFIKATIGDGCTILHGVTLGGTGKDHGMLD